MVPYIIPFALLSVLAIKENTKQIENFLNNKYLYYLICLFFIIFIGLRYEVGCDWNQYKLMFDKYSIGLGEMIKLNFTTHHYLHELGHIFISKISRENIYILNSIYAILFTVPLFYFLSSLKRKYLSLVISYPYYIIVIGMGPIRQAACISILMISIIIITQKRFKLHLLLTLISLLIHQFSLFFNALLIGYYYPEFIKKKLPKGFIFFVLIVLVILSFQAPSIIRKGFYYITTLGTVVAPAKSAILIWLINFFPAIIFLKNINKFNINKDLRKILIIFSILEIISLPIVFINSVISYRLLLYIFPTSIYITSQIPDLKFFKLKENYISNFMIFLSLSSLIIWIKFAYHASCWIPYKNILLN